MNINKRDTALTALTLAISLALANAASAQSMQHGSMPMEQGAQTQTQDHSAHQAPTSKPALAKKPATPAKTSEAMIDHAAMGHAAPSAEVSEPAMQGMDHSQMGHGSPASTPAAPKAQTQSMQGMDHSQMAKPAAADTAGTAAPAMQGMDHSKMGHGSPPSTPAKPKAPTQSMQGMDHSQMAQPAAADTSGAATPAMQGMDHSKMGHGSPAAATPEAGMQSKEGMDHSQMGHGPVAPTQPRTPIPAVTEADRKAAIAPAHAHPVHDNSIKSYVLLNRLEAWDADPGTGLGWEGQGWIGTDLNRVWLRSEGERTDGQTESADLEVLYGRSISTWWDVVAGVRHDFKPGASQNFAAIGVQGLAPMKFEVSATAYLGEGGQTAANVEAEYELLLTNRLILQPLVEVTAHGKNDPLRGIGSGLSTAEAGLRLRYEFTRKFAPYIGVVYERAFGNTADMRREHGESFEDTRLVIGLRTWF